MRTSIPKRVISLLQLLAIACAAPQPSSVATRHFFVPTLHAQLHTAQTSLYFQILCLKNKQTVRRREDPALRMRLARLPTSFTTPQARGWW